MVGDLPVFIGIDVACAKKKRLPICFASYVNKRLEPLEAPQGLTEKIPRGRGNREITDAQPFKQLAIQVVDAIQMIAEERGWAIKRIAVDAPAAAPASGIRASEAALSKLRLSNFQTPNAAEWPGIRNKCNAYLSAGHELTGLPYANMIWMLYGFEIFKLLRERRFEVIEVFPYSIVRALLPTCMHKSTKEGYADQLKAIAERTGWGGDPPSLEKTLEDRVSGSRHDRLDAFMAAWVASLDPKDREAHGDAANLDDAIWVPHSS
jgi:predicted nuclease with RNAse H fold